MKLQTSSYSNEQRCHRAFKLCSCASIASADVAVWLRSQNEYEIRSTYLCAKENHEKDNKSFRHHCEAEVSQRLWCTSLHCETVQYDLKASKLINKGFYNLQG